MEELLRVLRSGLTAGTIPSTGWTGVNSPGRLERAGGLWVSHGTARRYTPGTTSANYVSPLWEWAAVFDGRFRFHTATGTSTAVAQCSYIVPPGLRLGVEVQAEATLAVWFMVDGPLAGDALAALGADPRTIVVGAFTPAQASSALHITRLLFERPPGLSLLVQAQLWAFLAGAGQSGAGDPHPVYSPDIARVLAYLEGKPSGPLSANAVLADLAALAPSSFRRRFAAEVGMPPRRYQLHQRLRLAKHLLLRDNAPIKTVAHDLGFPDQLYFSRLFTRHEGISPSAFRRRFAARLPVGEVSSPPGVR